MAKKPTWKIACSRKIGLPVNRIYHPTEYSEDNDEFFYLPNTYTFEAVLKIIHIGDVVVSAKDLTTGHQYYIGNDDFLNLLNRSVVTNGMILGKWGFKKVSYCYRIYLT